MVEGEIVGNLGHAKSNRDIVRLKIGGWEGQNPDPTCTALRSLPLRRNNKEHKKEGETTLMGSQPKGT